jgi:hypothetical protein
MYTFRIILAELSASESLAPQNTRHQTAWKSFEGVRGHPLSLTLSLTLSSGEIPWFDVPGEIQRCDWLENSLFLYVSSMNFQAMGF